MPIEYTVNEDGTFVHATATGSPTDEDLAAYLESLTNDSRIKKPGYRELFDAGGISGNSVTMQALEKFAEFVRAHPERIAASKMAIVVGSHESFKQARFYEKLLKSVENIIVFNDAAVARIWLNEHESAVETKLK